ncbi:MAG: hypothetical protein EOP35_06045 [Rubrivivax sp.]|nr:MAG: hypothetical protein EOP35_06045 [Rubrivivax sp.]
MVTRCMAWLAAVLACCLALPSEADPPEPYVVVGRADADASGGWPVALWVIDGLRSHVIVRAPREQLGRQAWRPADAQALMALERFGAPRLKRVPEPSPCPAELGWGAIVYPPTDAHFPGERDELAHAPCGAGRCNGKAWRLDLPAAYPAALPLAALWPLLAAARPEWLVLYVVVPRQGSLTLTGISQLRVPDGLRAQRSFDQWREFQMPAQAAAHFPAIHTALLEQAASGQGLAQATVLMRSDLVSAVRPARYIGGWASTQAQRRALGLDGDSVRDHDMARLLLRVMPADRPPVLRPEGVAWQTAETFDGLRAMQLRRETPAACRAALSAMNCEAACESKVASMHEPPRWGFYTDKSLEILAPDQRLPACLRSCQAQKGPSDEALQRRFDTIAERQQQAWRWVEQMTGRSAADWQAR